MSDFSTRARMLAEQIELSPSDPAVEEELDALRTLWRSLPSGERPRKAVLDGTARRKQARSARSAAAVG